VDHKTLQLTCNLTAVAVVVMVVIALIAREGEWEEEEGGGNRFALTMMGIRESAYFTCTVYGGVELDPVCDTAVLLYYST
jgi:hypothetical protein